MGSDAELAIERENVPALIQALKEMTGEKPVRSKEEVYEDVTRKHLGNNPNGTRMDIVYAAMEEYSSQPRPFKMPVLVDEEGKEHEVLALAPNDEGGEYQVSIADKSSPLGVKSVHTNENCKLIQK
jgi:hypothetical protein